jgi:hypothetical protein
VYREMDDLGTKTTADYYFNESETISGSFDTKYYDEIITKLYLQARREYESTIQYAEKEKLRQEEKCIIKKAEGGYHVYRIRKSASPGGEEGGSKV